MKSKFFLLFSLTAILLAFNVTSVTAHCEIPCGIYNDVLRVKLIQEHATTIEKSINEIVKLSGENPVNYNQLVRWVNNKEDHANKVQEIVSQYFLTQRIKPGQDKYEEKLAALHQMLVAAMKCKQSTDLANVETLRELAKKFSTLYLKEADLEHLNEHHH